MGGSWRGAGGRLPRWREGETRGHGFSSSPSLSLFYLLDSLDGRDRDSDWPNVKKQQDEAKVEVEVEGSSHRQEKNEAKKIPPHPTPPKQMASNKSGGEILTLSFSCGESTSSSFPFFKKKKKEIKYVSAHITTLLFFFC